MILSVLRVMLLALLRDRGALVMAFVLPPAIYLIFAGIFSGTAGNELRLSVVVLDQVDNALTRRLVRALAEDKGMRQAPRTPISPQDVEAMVRSGEVDAGVVIRADPSADLQKPPIHIIGDASRAVAVPIVTGHVQRIFAERLPDSAYRRTVGDLEQRFFQLNPEQRARLEAALKAVEQGATRPTSTSPGARSPAPVLVETTSIVGRSGGADAAVIYYAGAVGVLFLLFSSVQGAVMLIDERLNGIADRLITGAGSSMKLIAGKFAFLVGQGVLQVGIIFAVAMALFGVDFLASFPAWLLVTSAASAMAAGSALLLCVLCRTRQQAQTFANFLVLVVSAIGGSMVPRYLMPAWLQDVGMLSPNAWAIEAYHDLLWRNAAVSELAPLVLKLAAAAVITLVAAWLLLSRERRA